VGGGGWGGGWRVVGSWDDAGVGGGEHGRVAVRGIQGGGEEYGREKGGERWGG